MELINAVDEIITNRRSVYTNMFSEEKVSDEIIEKMLYNANWAPTHKHTEPWRFVVFKGAGLSRLAEFQADLYKKKHGHDFDQKKYDKLRNKPMQCSHIIAIGMKRNEKEIIPEMEELAATACAVQNAWLTASAHRIGCYWSTGGVTFYEEAKEFFGLRGKDKLMGFLYIGKLKSDKWPKGKRQDIGEKVRWVSE